jgi:hypothetical protein
VALSDLVALPELSGLLHWPASFGAAADSDPADQVHPLLHRAWHMLSSENG